MARDARVVEATARLAALQGLRALLLRARRARNGQDLPPTRPHGAVGAAAGARGAEASGARASSCGTPPTSWSAASPTPTGRKSYSIIEYTRPRTRARATRRSDAGAGEDLVDQYRPVHGSHGARAQPVALAARRQGASGNRASTIVHRAVPRARAHMDMPEPRHARASGRTCGNCTNRGRTHIQTDVRRHSRPKPGFGGGSTCMTRVPAWIPCAHTLCHSPRRATSRDR